MNATTKSGMGVRKLGTLCALVAATCLVMSARVASSASPSGLAIRDVRTDGSTVTGWVDNQTGHEVRDVRLMVEQDFRWTNEMKPGDDNPGKSDTVRVPQPIPAGGSIQFRYDMPAPLPQRNDGHFETAVKVLSFSEHWDEFPTAAIPPRSVAP